MSDNRPILSPSAGSARESAPASSHIDEAVAHSHNHVHSPGAGHGAHSHDHSHSSASAARLGWALAVTGTVVVAELLGAFWSGSLSLAADAGHMVVDASGLVIALVAARLMRRPRDEKHTWGWARSEVLAAALQAGMLLVICVMVAWEGAWRLASPPEVEAGPMLLVGIIGLVTCGAILPVERAFPGYLALWPVLSGALVIMAGRTNSRWGIDRLLVSAPLQNLGNISYALYLVHWPILILYSSAVGTSRVNIIEGTIIILASIGLAWLLIRFVEKPLRYRKDPFVPWLMMKMRFKTVFSVKTWADQLAFILAIFLVAGVPLTAAQTWIGYRNAQSEQNAELKVQTASENYPGARAIGGAQQGLIDNPIPSGGDVKAQFDGLSDPCTGGFAPSDPALAKYCTVQKYGPEDAPLTMVVGNSHAEQALSIFKPIAEQTKTNLQTYLLGGCQYPVRAVNASNECSEFNTKMTEEILKRKPQTVVLIATVAQARSNDERIDPSLDETVRRLTEAGVQVIGLRDNPRFEYNIYECAQKAGADKSSCARPASDKYAAENPAKEVFDKYRDQGAVMVDLKDVYCPDGMCSPVVGNIYVYIDDNHVSKTYSRTMAQEVFQRAAEGGWLVNGKVNF